MTLELTGKATLILLATLLGSVLLRRRSAAARHLVQVLGLVALLALPALALTLPAWELPILVAETLARADAAAPPSALDLSTTAERPTSMDTASASDAECCDEPASDGATLETVPRSRSAATGVWPLRPRSIGGWAAAAALVLWAVGTAVLLARLALGWVRMNQLAIAATPLDCRRTRLMLLSCGDRLGTRTLPPVLTSSRIRVPALWGCLRPLLLLPASATSWPSGRLRIVLLHELGHLSRRDGLALLLGRLSTAAWWFHPLAWSLDRQARRECERACDDLVLASGERPSTYARHLLEIARELPPVPAPAVALSVVSAGQLEGRVRSILHPAVRRGLPRRAALALAVLVGLALGVVSSARPVARERDPGSRPPIVREASGQPGGAMFASGPTEGDTWLVHEEQDSAGERAFERAMDAHRREQFEQAMEGFRASIDAGFRVSTSMYNLACGYARLGDADAAVSWIERALEEGFDRQDLLFEDSDLDPIRAAAAFRALLERVGEKSGHAGRDRYDDAQERYEDLLDVGSTDGKAWYEVGTVLLGLRDYPRATDALQRSAERLGGGGENALYNLACAYALAGQKQQALDHLERAVLAGFESEERFRNDSDLDSIRSEKRFHEIEQLHETLSLDRFRGGNWSGSEYSARRWGPAVEAYEAFVAEHPDVGRAWSNLGWALHHSRRHVEARQAFETQLELDYRPGTATYNIGCTYAMEGNSDAALEWLGRAVDTDAVSVQHLLHDEDLSSLHQDARFEALLVRAAGKQKDLGKRLELKKMLEWRKQERAGALPV